MRTKFKAWTKPYLDANKDRQILDENDSFLKQPIYLEIGCGKGNFLKNMANKFPNLNFIGVEKNLTCSGITLKKLDENNVDNAKLFFGDILEFTKLLQNETVEAIFLNFSDPWPKKRHQKRRLTSKVFNDEYKRILKSGGAIYFKTDNQDLFLYGLKCFVEAHFTLISITNNYQEIDEFDEITEYEANFRSQNMPIYRAIIRKIVRK